MRYGNKLFFLIFKINTPAGKSLLRSIDNPFLFCYGFLILLYSFLCKLSFKSLILNLFGNRVVFAIIFYIASLIFIFGYGYFCIFHINFLLGDEFFLLFNLSLQF